MLPTMNNLFKTRYVIYEKGKLRKFKFLFYYFFFLLINIFSIKLVLLLVPMYSAEFSVQLINQLLVQFYDFFLILETDFKKHSN